MSQGNAAQSKFIPCQSSSKNPPRPSQYLSTYLDPAALARARSIAAASLARLFGQASPRAGEGPTEHEVGGGKSDFGLSTPDCQPWTTTRLWLRRAFAVLQKPCCIVACGLVRRARKPREGVTGLCSMGDDKIGERRLETVVVQSFVEAALQCPKQLGQRRCTCQFAHRPCRGFPHETIIVRQQLHQPR